MSFTAGGGAPRGGHDWTLLGGDPTPGDVDAVAQIAEGFARAAERASAAADQLGGLTIRASAARWRGPFADAFGPAVEPLQAEVAGWAESATDVAGAVGRWAQGLGHLQQVALRLVERAEDAEARHATAEGLLVEVAEPDLSRASADLATALATRDAGDIARMRLWRDEARGYRDDQHSRMLAAEAELETLREEATRLAEQHVAEAHGVTEQVGAGYLRPSTRPDFGSTLAIEVAASVAPGVSLDADDDGVVEAAELAAGLMQVFSTAVSRQDRRALLEALGPLIAHTMTDPTQGPALQREIGPDGYRQIVDTIIADLAALAPGEVQYDANGVAIARQEGLVEISLGHMGIRLSHEGEAIELTAAAIADAADAIGDRAAVIALALLLTGAVALSGGLAAIPIGGGVTVGSALATGGTIAAGTAVAAGGVELVAGGIIEGDNAHTVGGALNVLGGTTSSVVSRVPIDELDDLGRAAVIIRDILQLGTAQVVGTAQAGATP